MAAGDDPDRVDPDPGRSAPEGGAGGDVERPISPPATPTGDEAGAPSRAVSSTIVVVAGFLGVAACLLILGTLAEIIRDEEVNALDAFATPFLHAFASPQLDAVMRAATFLGSNEVVLPAFVLVVLVLLVPRKFREATFLAVVVLGSLALNGAMKLFFERHRPQLPWAQVLPDYSFPSGHSMISLAFLLGLAVVIWQLRGSGWGRVAVVAAAAGGLFIGTSRIYLGYHYLTDVIGGFVAAVLWILVVIGAFSWGQRLLDGRRAPSREASTARETRPAGEGPHPA